MNSVRPRAALYFDGQCPLCIRTVRLLQHLDVCKKIDYRDAREVRLISPISELCPGDLLEEMHLVPSHSTVALRGFWALRWIAIHLPTLWPLVPLLFLPGGAWWGPRVYRWIAINRFRLMHCDAGLCQLHRQKVKD